MAAMKTAVKTVPASPSGKARPAGSGAAARDSPYRWRLRPFRSGGVRYGGSAGGCGKRKQPAKPFPAGPCVTPQPAQGSFHILRLYHRPRWLFPEGGRAAVPFPYLMPVTSNLRSINCLIYRAAIKAAPGGEPKPMTLPSSRQRIRSVRITVWKSAG